MVGLNWARGLGRARAMLCPVSGLGALRSLLRLGVAGAALFAMGSSARAVEVAVTWSGGGSSKDWSNAANWVGGSTPSATSDVVVPGGLVKNQTVQTIVSTDVTAGSLTIGKTGAAAKAMLVQTQGAGTLDLGTLHLLAGGWLQLVGTTLPADQASLTVDNLNLDSNSILDIGAGNLVNVNTSFTLAGTAQGAGTLISSGTIVQTAGKMGIDHVTTASYSLTGGQTTATTITFSDNFALSGTGSVNDRATTLIGGEGSTMTQSGGVMGGTVSGIDSYTQTGGTVGTFVDGFINGKVTTANYELSGGSMTAEVNVSKLFALSGTGTVTSTGRIVGTDGSVMTQSGGTMAGTVTGIDRYTQSGGAITGTVSTDSYELADGTGDGFENVTIGSTLLQSGGVFDYDGVVVPTFTQSGGLFSGSIRAATYNQTDAAATSDGGTINASSAFNLEPADGTAVVAATLAGTGNLVKSGDSTVVLSGANSFTGTVLVKAGTLELQNGAALADTAAVTIADTAGTALLITDSERIGSLSGGGTVTIADGETLTTGDSANTVYYGSMGGETGNLTKEGSGSFTLAGEVTLGALAVNAGTLAIGDGTTTNTASFESAVIESGATVYIASGATLTIRVPQNITNNGRLINDGTVNDDLANASDFENNGTYNANVASNTDTINNNEFGVWTGNVLTNDGQIANRDGGRWIGDIKGNNNAIFNRAGSTWTGDVVRNGGGSNDGAQIDNYGAWIGDVKSNSGGIVVVAGSWTGDIAGNSGWIINNVNDTNVNIDGINAASWIGTVTNGTGSVTNDHGGSWTGDVLGNRGYIANRSDATWTGKVTDNAGEIDNLGDWIGDVTANHGSIYNISGSWTGDVLSNNGTLINNWNDDTENPGGINHAVWNGDVSTFEGVINDKGGTWNGRVLANNNAIFNMAGATWNGNVVANGGGSNTHAQIINYGAWDGDVETNALAIYNSNGSWTGDVLGNAGRIYNNFNDDGDNAGGVNAAVWTGDVTNTTGGVINDHFGIWNGNVLANDGTIINRSDAVWTGNVADNAGTITTAGTWNGDFTNSGTVNAENRINGAFDNLGLLTITGSLSGITTLTNDGTLNMVGGGAADTVSAASASFGSDSSFNIDIDATGQNDRLAVTGLATLDGTVQVTAKSGNYDAMTTYTILTAGSINGTFDGVTTSSAFLDGRLTYDPNDVFLTFARNNIGFAEVGSTANQQAAGAGAESLGAGNAIYDAILWLDGEQANRAFDLLSGAAYASFDTAFIQDASLLSDAVNGRIDQAFDGVAAAQDPTRRTGLWGQIYGANTRLSGDGNTSDLRSSSGGFLGGVDEALGDWRLGVVLQAGTTNLDVPDLDTSADSTDYGLGAYGGREWGNTRLSLGAAYTQHDISATRRVDFDGFSDNLEADYGAGTAQVFGKLSQRVDLGVVSVVPFATLAYVSQRTDSFSETGGAAALDRAANRYDALFTTPGIGIDRNFLVGETMLLTAKGSIGWRHAFAGDAESAAAIEGGSIFLVDGTALETDSGLLTAGLDLAISPRSALSLDYRGQIGTDGQSQSIKGSLATQF
ncbi:autotransporter domain-containing protein [Kaistia sp. UC242_56]|uniref:autotransporter domain-containing protein n=1 Tax=Kaistia sp. UC242_56 TaxID=3374625 RepID=UPI0037BBC726